MTQTKEQPKCRWCKKGKNKALGEIKYYIIADDLERPKPYHKKCIDELYFEAILKMSGIEHT